MSVTTYEKQTAWEETEEEYRKRCETAQSAKSSWAGTVVGLLIAIPLLLKLVMVW